MPKKMVIHIDPHTSEILIKDERGKKLEEVPAVDVQPATAVRTEEVALFFTHSSPACVHFRVGGRWYRRRT